jgi:hypothetical protein
LGGKLLDCAPGKGFTPGSGVSGIAEEPKGAEVVGLISRGRRKPPML